MLVRNQLLALIAALAATSAFAHGSPAVKVIAEGLNNPRGLAFAPSGWLYVAEAGSGGNGTCRASPEPDQPDICYGETGALTRVDPKGKRAPHQVVRNLPSMAAPGGFAATSGPVDVDFDGSNAFVAMGWGGDPTLRDGIGPKSKLFGTTLLVTPNRDYFPVSDISANEVDFNPAGGFIDSNPYGVLALDGRRIVADAGSNALVESKNTDLLFPGSDRTFVVLPPTAFGKEPVPTSVARGPDGSLYVGELTGAPFFQGSSTIYKVSPDGSSVTPYVTGLTAVVDMAFDRKGTLYIVEIASGFVAPPAGSGDPGVGNGRLLRKRGNRPVEVVLDGLVFPAGVAIDRRGDAYLTQFGIFPGGGQVIRVSTH